MQSCVSMCSVRAASATLRASLERRLTSLATPSARAANACCAVLARDNASDLAPGSIRGGGARWPRGVRGAWGVRRPDAAVGLALLAAAVLVGAAPSLSAAAGSSSAYRHAPGMHASAANSTAANSTAVNSTAANSTAANSTAANSTAANSTAVNSVAAAGGGGATSAAVSAQPSTGACLSRCFDDFVREARNCRERSMECVEFIDGLCLVRNLNHARYADCIDKAQARHRACAAQC